MISAHTTLCISISSSPGRMGTLAHNAGYRALGLDYLYKAFQVHDLANAIAGVRGLGIRGCSVSMPFKEAVIPYLDTLDPSASAIGAVNTIVNEQGRLIGYNTDAIGAQEVLVPFLKDPEEPILVLGAGGVARAILYALQQLGMKRVFLSSRSPEKSHIVAQKFGAHPVPWGQREDAPASILIHAVPLDIPVVSLTPFRLVMDVVVSPSGTSLIREAQKLGIPVIEGVEMALHQAFAQFSLYTGQEAPRDAMRQAVLL